MNDTLSGMASPMSFERTLASLRPELVRFALWLARDRQVAEDVVQEAMLRAWKSQNELSKADALRPWLLTIVRREHARLYERKRLPTTDIDALVALDDPALAASGQQELEELRAAIMRLTDDYREPLVMQVLGGFSTSEIAAELGLTQPAVLTRLFRAREKLREIYGVAAQDVSGAGEPT
jgi:RNA polymerase sigma-70 factor (ECF subfamily)